MRWVRLIPALLIIAIAATAPLVFAEPNGTIHGQVTNGTGQGGPVAGIEVELLTLVNRQGPPVITTATTDEKGQFVFESVDNSPENAHLLRITYLGQTYFSDLLTFEKDKNALEVPLVVYEITHESKNIAFRRTHLIVEFDGEQTFIAQLHFVDNNGDQTFVGSDTDKNLFFALPAGANNLKFQDPSLEGLVTRVGDGFYLNQSLTPGETQILFSYSLPYKHPDDSLSITLTHDVPDLVLLVSDIGQTVEAPALTAQGVRPAQGANYYAFNGTGFSSGAVVKIDLHNLPVPPSTSSPTDPTPPSNAKPADIFPSWLGLVLLVVGALAAFLYATTHRPRADAATRVQTIRKSRVKLLESIARLDQQYEKGQIGQATYRKERAMLKKRLIRILREQQG